MGGDSRLLAELANRSQGVVEIPAEEVDCDAQSGTFPATRLSSTDRFSLFSRNRIEPGAKVTARADIGVPDRLQDADSGTAARALVILVAIQTGRTRRGIAHRPFRRVSADVAPRPGPLLGRPLSLL